MFSYLRYFSTISFILVIIAAIIAGMYYRSVVAEDIIKVLAERNNISYARNYVNLVWKKHFQNYPAQQMNSYPGIAEFRGDSERYLSGVPLTAFMVYSPKGESLIALGENKLQSVDTERQSDFAVAQQGNAISRTIGDKWSNDFKSSDTNKIVVRSLVPVFMDDSSTPLLAAVVELVYDVTPLWKEPIRLQIIGTAVIIFIFSILYISLLYTISRAEKIITKQHESNLELSEAKIRAEAESQEKSKFLANISHELRTPLNAIIGFSEILKDEVMGPINNDQYKDYINDIHASGVHLLSLINDILDYSKAEAGKLEVEMVDVDVTKVMQSCLRLVSPRAEAASVILVDEIPKDHYVVKTDPKRLKQILLNLLSNSVKFTPAQGKVSLSSWYNVVEGTLHIEVKDTGIGIAPKDISKVMSTFGQVQNEYNRKYEGTGLGLPLSKKLIELMGGRFIIESQVGTGTKITIVLPKDKIQNAPGQQQQQQPATQPPVG